MAHNPPVLRVAEFTSYYDTSGNASESPFVVTVGLVSLERKWEAFTREWDKVLAEFGLS